MPQGLVALRQEMRAAIQRCVPSGGEAKVHDTAGEGYRGRRPRFLVVTPRPLSEERLGTLLEQANGAAVVWPFYAAEVRDKPAEGARVGKKRDPAQLRTPMGSALPWNEYLMKALAVVQPRDIVLIGPVPVKNWPRRPVADHATRGREFVPLEIRGLPRFTLGEDWGAHMKLWTAALRDEWQRLIVPHLREHYFVGAVRVADTADVDALRLLQQSQRQRQQQQSAAAKPKPKAAGPKKARPEGADAFAVMRAANRKRRFPGYLDGPPDQDKRAKQ